MPPKGSIKLNAKRKQIGEFARKRKSLASLEETLYDLDCEINKLEHRLSRKKARIENLKETLKGVDESELAKVTYPIVSIESVKRRKKNPTQKELNDRSRRRRRNETDRAARAIHGSRRDKLKTFENFSKKNVSSLLFLMCIGGDEAPSAGTSFLISFLNVGKRIASSFENYLLFGANVKENGAVVKRYLKILMQDIRFLESKIFSITVDDENYNIEFKLHGVPNDMKMLAFLAGEISNASQYFTTFANVSSHDAMDVNKTFSMDRKSSSWKPFNYADRIEHASLVAKKKLELSKKNIKESTRRSNLTDYISNKLKSRQEFVPIIEEYVDLVKCEPLHLKNNCTKELFMKILDIVIAEAKLPSSIQDFKQVPELNIFRQFISFIKSEMNSNFLGKKLIAW